MGEMHNERSGVEGVRCSKVHWMVERARKAFLRVWHPSEPRRICGNRLYDDVYRKSREHSWQKVVCSRVLRHGEHKCLTRLCHPRALPCPPHLIGFVEMSLPEDRMLPPCLLFFVHVEREGQEEVGRDAFSCLEDPSRLLLPLEFHRFPFSKGHTLAQSEFSYFVFSFHFFWFWFLSSYQSWYCLLFNFKKTFIF